MKDIIIYYIPFDVETLTPITKELIDKKAHCVFRFPLLSDEVTKLKNIIGETEFGNFNNKVVRMKIENVSDKNIFIDIEGGLSIDDKTNLLSKEAFKRLRELMSTLAKENPDCCSELHKLFQGLKKGLKKGVKS